MPHDVRMGRIVAAGFPCHVTQRGNRRQDAWVLDNTFGDVFNDTAQQNGRVNVASNQYDGQDRLILATAPERGTVAYTYSPDLEHNVVQVTRTPKPGSPLSALTTTYSYDPTYNKPIVITDPLGLAITMTYDPGTGNVLSTVADSGSAPHLNAKSSFTYNGFGQVLTATDPLQTVTQLGYDGHGNPTSVTRDVGSNRLNQLTTMAYSALGDVISLTDPNGHVTTSTYDAARHLSTQTAPGSSAAPSGVVTANSYDRDGRLLQTQQAANGAVLRTASATYTLTGQPATATDANGNAMTFAYDTVDRLARTTDPLNRTTSYAYDTMSRRTQVLNTAVQGTPLLQQSYTPDGLIGGQTDANNHNTSLSYDGLDRLATTTYPDTSTETLSYDADSNVLSRKTRANQTISFTYDTLNRPATKTPPSPWAKVTYGFDIAGRLRSVSDNSVAITPAVAPGGSTVSYTANYAYDNLNRPINITWSPAAPAVSPTASAVTFAHTYNKANQRMGQSATDNSWWYYPAATPSAVNYTANTLDQYTAVGSVTPSYDGNGNLTFDGTFTYGYDAENRMTSVMQGSTGVATYAFDGQGRRKLKTVGTTTTVYVTDASNREILEYDGSSGQIQRWYAYGLGANGVLNQMNVVTGTRATFVPGIQGSILATLDSSTGALSKTGYLAYGRSGSVPASFGYTGQRADPETNGLYYYHARMYMPAWGRFMQPDPIGYAGGSNLYRYVGNDPLNRTDSTGLAADQPATDATTPSANPSPVASDSGPSAPPDAGSSPPAPIPPAVGPSAPASITPTGGLGIAVAGAPAPEGADENVQLVQELFFFARPPLIPRGMTPLEELPPGSAGGPDAGAPFPRSFNNQQPENVPCAYCGRPTTREPGPDQLNGDHVIPKSQGGNGSYDNYVPSCRTCNLDKGGSSPSQWYILKGWLSS
jgi:RHS repeat-associated protein